MVTLEINRWDKFWQCSIVWLTWATTMDLYFCYCWCSSIVKLLLFSYFFLFSALDSLPEGSHCSFEEGLCGWTLNGTAASPWSIRGFSETIQEDSFVGSTLQATGGRFFIVLSSTLCVCMYTIVSNLSLFKLVKKFWHHCQMNFSICIIYSNFKCS